MVKNSSGFDKERYKKLFEQYGLLFGKLSSVSAQIQKSANYVNDYTSALQNIGKVVNKFNAYQFTELATINNIIKNMYVDLAPLIKSFDNSDVIRSLANVGETLAFAQKSLSTINWAGLYKTFNSDNTLQIRKSFVSLSEQTNKIPISKLPTNLVGFPSIELYNSSSLLKTLSVKQIPPVEDQEKEIVEEIEDQNRKIITDFNAGLINMLDGAKKALVSDNPERIRHCLISLRELMTQVIHKLAPDDRITTWSTSADDFCNGRPTRRARLKYICHRVDNGLEKLIDLDINSIIEVFNLLQKVHQPEIDFQEPEARIILRRVETAASFIIEISNTLQND